jgi:hypothetical protein
MKVNNIGSRQTAYKYPIMIISKGFRKKGDVGPLTTHKSTISEPYKHLRITKAFIVWYFVAKVSFLVVVSFGHFIPDWDSSNVTMLMPWSTYPKTVEIIWLNDMHTNSYTGPRLCTQICINSLSKKIRLDSTNFNFVSI